MYFCILYTIKEKNSVNREKKININERVTLAKNDKKLANDLIQEYTPFLKAIVGNYIRYKGSHNFDDLLSVAMESFYEAILSFNKDKGYFISFAKLVVTRRLINYITRESKTNKEIPFSSLYKEDKEKDNDRTIEFTDPKTSMLDNPCRWEIEAIKDECLQFKIDFFKLAKSAPKTEKTKRICADIINYITKNDLLLKNLRKDNRLPLNDITDYLKVPRKTAERHRQYIITAVIIATGDYPYLYEYLALPKDVKL